ncbi:MAG: nucleoside diphosphate kinase regulator [Myxococcaceae bacterium]|nr:nucleoside diphosphate kinase regulator [Myxococcaceae bacterium]
MTTPNRILVTTENLERLSHLVEKLGNGRYADQVAQLEVELARAEVVPSSELPPDVVTMNSRVLFEVEGTGERRIVTLSWPNEANLDPSRVSVLAPVGIALLGLRPGDVFEYAVPGDHRRRLKVLQVIYQPESESRPTPPQAA